MTPDPRVCPPRCRFLFHRVLQISFLRSGKTSLTLNSTEPGGHYLKDPLREGATHGTPLLLLLPPPVRFEGRRGHGDESVALLMRRRGTLTDGRHGLLFYGVDGE